MCGWPATTASGPTSERPLTRVQGVVDALVSYVMADLMVPEAAGWDSLAEANQAAVARCVAVNASVHPRDRRSPSRAAGD